MATREGARALGQEGEIGSIEPGKRADLLLIDRADPHLVPSPDPWSTIVYSARGTDVRSVVVDGELLVHEFALTRMDAVEVSRSADGRGCRAGGACWSVIPSGFIMFSSRSLRVLNHDVDAS